MTILKTTSENKDFQTLVHQLDSYLAIINGDENPFFTEFNQINEIKNVVVVYLNNQPIGCGAIKSYNKDSMEIKRMFVSENQRGNGIASKIIIELEAWAQELGYQKIVLETAKEMKDAVHLYLKNGYQIIPNYSPYENVESSVCFEKIL